MQMFLCKSEMYFSLWLCRTLQQARTAIINVTVLAKTCIIRTKTKFSFIAIVDRHTNINLSPVYQVLNVNWSAFVKGILPTLQSHGWNNGTHGGHQFDSGDLYLLPLAVWPTSVLLATVWASWLLVECPIGWFLPPPTPPTPPHPTLPHCPSHPPLLLSILKAERDSKNTIKFSHQR